MIFFNDDISYLPLILMAAIISIVFHELAHGYVALWNGDPTAKYDGRLTLNPFAHFDIFGFMMMVMVGFGFAKPVPVNPNNFRQLKRGIFTTAVAGVVVNFILCFFSIPLYIMFAYYWNLFYVAQFFAIMILLNAGLIIFNLLPIYPLDGFRVVQSFTHHTHKYCRFMQNYGFYILIGLMFWGMVVDFIMSIKGMPSWVAYIDILGTGLSALRRLFLWPLFKLWSLIMGVEVTV